jgi:integrase
MGLEPPAVPDGAEIRFLTPQEVSATVAAVPTGPYADLDRAMIRMAAMTGLREGELVALRWSDVDWYAARVRVRRNHDSRNPGEGFGTPKSRRSSRSVPLADEVAHALDALSKLTGGAGDALVFADAHTGGPQSKRSILFRYREALRAAGLDDSHRFHDLRHTFGTAMAAAGLPMRTLQEFMGHADFATTLRYAGYAPSPAHERDLVAAAFGCRGPIGGPILSEPEVSSRDLSPTNMRFSA